MENHMGLLGAVGAGLAEAGGAGAKIGMEQIRAAIEADRDARLNEMRSQADLTARARNKDDATAERARVAEFSRPVESQPNGLIAQGAGANDADNQGADESIGVDVQNRERPATYKQAAERAAVAGDLNSAKGFEGLDNNDEKIKAAQVVAEMRQRYNTDRLTQQGQQAMMKLAASIAKGANGGKLPAEAQMIEYLVEQKIVPDKKAAAEWVKQGKHNESDTEQVTTENGEETKRVVTKKAPSGKASPVPAKKVVKFGDLK